MRLSLTADCSLRCIYCRPDEMGNGADADLLTAGEIESLVRHLAENHGLSKVRLTGGEPAERDDLVEIVSRLAKIPGLNEVVMTTNGLRLATQAEALAKVGLKRVNVSLDSLDREKYQRITGMDGLPQVIRGIDAAIAAGLMPVKLNTVVVRGENDWELPDLLLFAAWKHLEIRFIELMPLGPLAARWQERFVSEEEMRQRLADMGINWATRPDTSDPAKRYTAGMSFGRSARVGFITAMSCPFCKRCNRVRIAGNGTVYPCLMDKPSGSLLGAIRPKFNAAAIDHVLQQALENKAEEHPATGPAMMPQIGR